MESFRASDRTLGVVIGAATIAYLVAAWRIPAFSLGTVPVQSRAFPLGLGAVLLTLSVVLVLRPGTPPVDEDDDARPDDHAIDHRTADSRVEVLVLMAGAAAYIAALVPLGFVLATALYVIATAWWFSYGRPGVAFAVGAGLAVGTQLAFAQLLSVRLPSGILAPLGL